MANSKFTLYTSAIAIAWFVWLVVMPERHDAEFEERMKKLGAECAIYSISAQPVKSMCRQTPGFSFSRWYRVLASGPAIGHTESILRWPL
jgi:hypothetical protein